MAAVNRWLPAAHLFLLAHVACSAAAPSLLTPAQAQFIAEAQAPAAEASRHAETELLAAFNSPKFRMELALQGMEAKPLLFKSAAELLEDLKDALHSLEFLFSFGLDAASAALHPGQPDWDLAGIDHHGHIPTLWELKVDGKAKALPEAQWQLVDAEETGLYRQPLFAKAADPNMTEAALRPSYVSGNLAHLDAGIWEFGVYAPVYRQSVLKERAVVTGVDGGGWTTVCNSSSGSMNRVFKWLKYAVDCDAIYAGGNASKGEVVFGTMDNLLHSFYANTKTFGVFGETLARRMYQFMIPGASMHPLEDNMYLEAVLFGPARMQDMKLFVASFPDVFGTPEADELREFCKRHGVPLAWAFGGGKLRKEMDMSGSLSHRVMWLPHEPFVEWPVNGERLLDPSSWVATHSQAPAGISSVWASIEAEAKKIREENPSGLEGAPYFTSWWTSLKASGGVVRQLKGKDCTSQLDLCFGTSASGECVCRQDPDAVSFLV